MLIMLKFEVVWCLDTRAGDREAVHIIEPQKNESCARPNIGKWIGCVAVDKADDWMVSHWSILLMLTATGVHS